MTVRFSVRGVASLRPGNASIFAPSREQLCIYDAFYAQWSIYYFLDLAAHLITRDEEPTSIERGGRKAHAITSYRLSPAKGDGASGFGAHRSGATNWSGEVCCFCPTLRYPACVRPESKPCYSRPGGQHVRRRAPRRGVNYPRPSCIGLLQVAPCVAVAHIDHATGAAATGSVVIPRRRCSFFGKARAGTPLMQ
jgi:hypothetical protein